MAKLTFQAADVRRVVEHALAATEHSPEVTGYDKAFEPITKPGVPSVVLVHDQGIYLMSNGMPRDPKDPAKPDGSSFVAYAKGCHPDIDEDFWDNGRDLVGGDDFAETLPWATEILKTLNAGATSIVINFGKTQVSFKGAR